MKANEKARELVDTFNESLNHISIGSNGIEDILLDRAKACAIICVNEIISSRPTKPVKGTYFETFSDRIDESAEYWQSVRKEIESL